MYAEKTRTARHIEQKTRSTVVSFHGLRMNRHGTRAVIGAMMPLIATLLLRPRQDRSTDRRTLDRAVPYGFADTDAERREGSP